MKKAKVALELQPCLGNRSGIGVYTYELAKRMQDTDRLSFSGTVFNFLNHLDLRKDLDGITMPIYPSSLVPGTVYRLMPEPLTIPRHWLFPDADLSLFLNYVVPKRIRGKVAMAIHDMAYMRFPETLSDKTLSSLRRNVQRGVERADRIITVSEFSKREIHELLQVPLEQIAVIPNAASISDATISKEELYGKFGIEKPYILFVGTIEPRKNLTRVLQAFELLKKEQGIPHQLVLAGGKGWKNEEIYATVDSLSSAKDIIFTGFVSGPEKNTLLKYAQAFVFPSLYEGFGIPPLEAMHFGCPVVCSDAASLPEVCGDAAEMVDAYKPESIASGLWNVISDEVRRSMLIQNGYRQEQTFTWDDSYQKLVRLCEEILEI